MPAIRVDRCPAFRKIQTMSVTSLETASEYEPNFYFLSFQKLYHRFNVMNDDALSTYAELMSVSGDETNKSKVVIPLKSENGEQSFEMSMEIVEEKGLFFIKDMNISYTLMQNYTGLNISEERKY